MKKQKLLALAAAATITALSLQSANAAIEIDEKDLGPTYGSTVADATVGKPLQLVNAVGGSLLYVLSYPFSYFGGNTEQAHQKLVAEPWNAMKRCLGCTVAEDNYYKSKAGDKNVTRIVVDQPSEIIINTNDNVVVSPQ